MSLSEMSKAGVIVQEKMRNGNRRDRCARSQASHLKSSVLRISVSSYLKLLVDTIVSQFLAHRQYNTPTTI